VSRAFIGTPGRLLALLAFLLAATLAAAQAPGFVSPLEPLDTTSPRATFETARALGDDLDAAFSAYAADPSFARQRALRAVLARADRLFDLRDTAVALRSEAGRAAFASLKDVLMRLPPLDPAALPADPATAPDRVRLPGTEIEVVRIAEGPDRSDFLFSADTVQRLPEFRDRILAYPILNPAPYASWREEQIRFTGPLVPWVLAHAMPAALETLVLGTPLWKLAAIALIALAVWLAAQWAALALRRAAAAGPVVGQLWRLSVPVVACVLILLARACLNGQIILSGTAFRIGQAVSLAGLVLSVAWIARSLIALVAEAIVAAPAFVEHEYDTHLVRLVSRVTGLVAAAAVIVYGANLLGVPLLGLVAGVGVGGFALALAAQSTVENLFGGVSIFADRPFRVGDFIIYQGGQGYVEAIGPRSTRIRALDGMLITVPNADLAKMQVTNKTTRDSTLFRHAIGFAQTSFRPALAEFSRRMLDEIGHCPLDDAAEQPPWVRVVGLGPDSIDVEICADLIARDEDDFTRQQEALLLAALAHAEALGLAFASPIQIVAITRLDGPGPRRPRLTKG
jgi:MscS family membrane protein